MPRKTKSGLALFRLVALMIIVARWMCAPSGAFDNALALTSLPSSCYEALVNGGFEGDDGWWLPLTAYPASFTWEASHSGIRSVRLGITDPGQNTYSYSSVSQAVHIPATSTAILRFWLYPMSAEAAPSLAPKLPSGHSGPDLFGALASDVQYVLVLDAADNWIGTLLWLCSNERQWTMHTFDLTSYAGQTIQLRFGVFNTGSGGVTAAYVDDATLEICPAGSSSSTPSATATASLSPSATPTRTATPTATLIPCIERVANGGFESSGSWYIPDTAYSAGYTTVMAHNGNRALRLGIVEPGHNTYSYSDANQTVSIPAGVLSAVLRFWIYPMSGDPRAVPTPQPRLLGNPLATGYLPYDVQYLLLLDASDHWIDTLFWQCDNNRQWLYDEYDLTHYAGRTIKLHFGAYNTGAGGITAYYLDDVSLQVCWQLMPTPGAPTATPTWLATPSYTVTPHPVPAQVFLPLLYRSWLAATPTPTPTATPTTTPTATLPPYPIASATPSPTGAATIGPYPLPLSERKLTD